MPSGNLSLQAQLNVQEALKGLRTLGTSVLKLATMFGKLPLILAGVTGGFAALNKSIDFTINSFTALVEVVGDWIEQSFELDAAERRLEAAIRTTGQAAGFTFEQMSAMAGEMEKTSVLGTGQYIKMMDRMAYFTNIQNENFKEAIMLADDLAQSADSAPGQAALQLGRAFNDATYGLNLLAQSGRNFTEVEKDMLRAVRDVNGETEYQATLVQMLKQRMGEASESIRDSGVGAWRELGESVREFESRIGQQFANAFRPLVEEIIKLLDQLTEAIREGALEGILSAVNEFAQFVANIIKMLELNIRAIIMLDELYEKHMRRGAFGGIRTMAGSTGIGEMGAINTLINMGRGFNARIAAIEEAYAPPPTDSETGENLVTKGIMVKFWKDWEEISEQYSEEVQKDLKKFKDEIDRERERYLDGLKSFSEGIKEFIDPTLTLVKQFERMQAAIAEGFLTAEQAAQYLEDKRQDLIDSGPEAEAEDSSFRATLLSLKGAGESLQQLAASREDKVEEAIKESAARAERQRQQQIRRLDTQIRILRRPVVARAG